MKKLVLLTCLICFSVHLFAGKEVVNSRISGSTQITVGATLKVADGKQRYMESNPSTWPSEFTNTRLTTKIRLGIDPYRNWLPNMDYSGKVKVSITYWDELMAPHTLSDKILEVDYQTGGDPVLATDLYSFPGAIKAEITILEITENFAGMDNLFLELEQETERYYTYDYTAFPETTPSQSNFINALFEQQYDANHEELVVSWDAVTGAEAYELEWIFVAGTDNPSTNANLKFDFEERSTRIRTYEHQYRIPLVYDYGVILYRLRPLYKSVSDNYQNFHAGRWSDRGLGATTVSAYPADAVYQISNNSQRHEKDKTWQFQMTFNEMGNNSQSIVYADPAGKPRQSISRNNQEDEVVVSSGIFDSYGRPVIEVLPSPVNQQSLNYVQNLNLYDNGGNLEPLHPSHFDTETFRDNLCVNGPVVIDPASAGAGNYYSTANPNQDGAEKYLPDAKGFPYVQMEYRRDNTGTVMRTSGVGGNHQIGSGHDVFHLFGDVDEEELSYYFEDADRGLHEGYTKRLTLDPNRVMTKEIYNGEGQMVLKQVTGSAPSNLHALSKNVVTYTSDLLKDATGNGLHLSTTKLLHEAGDYEFAYDLTFDSYAECNLCYTCHYDFELTVEKVLLDPCGAETRSDVFSMVYPVGSLASNVTCPSPGTEVLSVANGQSNMNITIASSDLQNGPVKLIITKTLTVSEQSKEDYRETYLANYCGPAPETYLGEMDPVNCNFDYCTFLFHQEYGVDLAEYNSRFDPDITQGAYDQLKTDEIEACNEPLSRCELYKEQIKGDFFPGNQYAGFEDDPVKRADPNYSYTSDSYSIFNTSNSLRLPGFPNTVIDYKYFNGQYTDSDGNSVTINNVNDFLQYYHRGWLDLFMPAHPEYPCVDFVCGSDEPAESPAPYEYADLMLGVESFAEAKSLGLLNPLGLTLTSTTDLGYYTLNCTGCNSDLDLYFTYSGPPAASGNSDLTSLKTWVKTSDGKFEDGQTPTANDVNIYVGAYIMTVCDASSASSIYTCLTDAAHDVIGNDELDLDNLNCDEDKWWMNFRALYLHKRNLLVDDHIGAVTGCSVPSGKEARVPRFEELFGSVYDTLDTKLNQDPIDYGSLQSILNSGTSCSGMATALADDWMNDLAACSGMTTGTALYNNVRAGLIGVYTNACENDHVFGSQETTVPFTITIGMTNYPCYSFNDVLNAYSVTQSESCSVYLIDAPRLGVNLATNGVLDKCGCDAILQNEANFTNTQYSKPDGVSTEKGLFLHTYGLDIENLNEKKCQCESVITGTWQSGYNWSATEESNLANLAVTVPKEFTCPSTLNCSTINNERTSSIGNTYKAMFPNFATSANDLKLFTRFMNHKYELELTPIEYDEMLKACGEYAQSAPIKTISWGLTPQAGDLVEMLNDLAQFQDLTASSLVLKKTHDIYYGSLYNCQPLSTSSITLTTSQTAGVSTMVFTDNNYCWGSCSVDLDEPTTPYTLDDILGFDQIEALINSTSAATGPQYDFRIRARFANGVTEWLEGSSTCWPVFEDVINPGTRDLEFSIGGFEPVNHKQDCGNREQARTLRNAAFNRYLEKRKGDADAFVASYQSACESVTENFTYTSQHDQTAITLFYYDVQGQLVQTVSPQGVDQSTNNDHLLTTKYEYNTLGEITYSQTPDGDDTHGSETYFWYDQYGRLVASQNSEQAMRGAYSYTEYDDLGRVVESGEISDLAYLDGNGLNSTAGEMTDALARDAGALQSWLTTGPSSKVPVRTDVVRTIYDDQLPLIESDLMAYFNNYRNSDYHNFKQKNLMSRVVSVLFFDATKDGTEQAYEPDENYDRALHYSYDAHGNVTHYIQEEVALKEFGHEKKMMEYEYDLLTNQVISMSYQKDEADQLIHQYIYDRNEKLREALVTTDGENWDRIADYKYLRNGMLARQEVGEHKVQGVDYTYTIQGWLKGVNASTLVADRDLGKDADDGTYLNGQTDLHKQISKDVFGYELKYYGNDYDPVDASLPLASNYFLAEIGSTIESALWQQYNGNIAATTTVLADQNGAALPYFFRKYEYDQLYRIRNSRNYTGTGIESANSFASATATDDYNTDYTFNKDGDLLTLTRNAYGSNRAMDNLNYAYADNGSGRQKNHKLQYVRDAHNIAWNVDIGDQDPVALGGDNYAYNEIGQLTEDKTEEIEAITWNPSGKVREILRTPTSQKDELEFSYGPMGNRWYKSVRPRGSQGRLNQYQWNDSYYVRDPQGNIMAVYGIGFEKDGGVYTEICDADLNHEMISIDYDDGSVMMPITSPYPVALTGSTVQRAQILANAINAITTNPDFYATVVGNCVRIYSANGSATEIGDLYLEFVTGETTINREAVVVADENRKQLHLAEHHLYGSQQVGVKNHNRLVADIEATWQVDGQGEVSASGATVSNSYHNRRVRIWMSANLLDPADFMVDPNPTSNDRTVATRINQTDLFTPVNVGGYANLSREQQVDDLVTRINAVSTDWIASKVQTGSRYDLVLESLTPRSESGFTLDFGSTALDSTLNDYQVLFYDEEQHHWGKQQYEMSNHLGNVLEVVSDKRLPGKSWTLIHNHTFSGASLDGFTGQNGSNVINLGNGLKVYQLTANTDAQTQKAWTLTPGKTYRLEAVLRDAGNSSSMNMEIRDGGNLLTQGLTYTIANPPVMGQLIVDVSFTVSNGNVTFDLMGSTTTGNYADFSLEAVRVYEQIGAQSVNEAEVLAYSDYYPFGMLQPGRNYSSGSYRYGFQSQERDDEIVGSGNSYTASYWQYDSRLGRRWNVDPVLKEHESPYASFANNPIWFMDPDGADTTRGKNGELYWKVEEGDNFYNIGKRLVEYGLQESNIYKDLQGWNSHQSPTNMKIGSSVFIERTFVISQVLWPTLYEVRLAWLEEHPEHFTLTYRGAQSNPVVKMEVNAARRCATAPCRPFTTGIPGIDADEFPYASTFQGGCGAGCWPINSIENQGEGRMLGVFYRQNEMVRGDMFNVRLTDLDGIRVPVPAIKPIFQIEREDDPKMDPIYVPLSIRLMRGAQRLAPVMRALPLIITPPLLKEQLFPHESAPILEGS